MPPSTRRLSDLAVERGAKCWLSVCIVAGRAIRSVAPETTRSGTSARTAIGLTPFGFAVWIGGRGLADPTDRVAFRGCHGVLDRAADGVDPQNAQPALHCDRGRDAADAVWRADAGGGAQGQGPGAGLCGEPAL